MYVDASKYTTSATPRRYQRGEKCLLSSLLTPGGGGFSQKRLGWGVRLASQNPYPVYDQICDFPYPIYYLAKNSIPYL